MIDTGCDASHGFLCERSPAGACGNGVVQPGEECDDVSSTSGTCEQCKFVCAPDEFKDPLTHHCYRVFTGNNRKGWGAASAHCQSLGGYLAAISSAQENQLVVDHMPGESWIGGERDPINSWLWVNGERFCFEPWHRGEPSPGEDCIEVSNADGTWNNNECTEIRDYVCEREP
jgi:hypothetical protein